MVGRLLILTLLPVEWQQQQPVLKLAYRFGHATYLLVQLATGQPSITSLASSNMLSQQTHLVDNILNSHAMSSQAKHIITCLVFLYLSCLSVPVLSSYTRLVFLYLSCLSVPVLYSYTRLVFLYPSCLPVPVLSSYTRLVFLYPSCLPVPVLSS